MNIRKAKMEEGSLLGELALRSKAHWGYDDDFMEKAREDLSVSAEYISVNHVYVMEEASKIIGFFSLIVNSEKSELDALFIDPVFIGKGFGRLLWKKILEEAEILGVDELTVIADPHAEGFYKKMGATYVGNYKSTIFENRELPLMKVVIQQTR